LKRSHQETSLNSFLPNFSTLVDKVSFNKFFSYNLNLELNKQQNLLKYVDDYLINFKHNFKNSIKNQERELEIKQIYLNEWEEILKDKYKEIECKISDVNNKYNELSILKNENVE
jgi:hypothetical protein